MHITVSTMLASILCTMLSVAVEELNGAILRDSSSRKWHETGIDSKRNVHVIANPTEGFLGVQREVENPAHPSARSGSTRHTRVASVRSEHGTKQQVNRLSSAEGWKRDNDEGSTAHSSARGLGSPSKLRSSGSSSSSDSDGGGSQEKNTQKKICGIVVKDYDDLPDLPKLNFLNWSRSNPVRRKMASLALNPMLDNFWMLCAVIHCLIILPEFEDNVFGCKMSPKANKLVPSSYVKECAFSLPGWHHFLFVVIFWVELMLKVTAFGLTGGKFAYWTHDFYNKLDFIATVSYVPEIIYIGIYGQTQFSFRAFRLMRLLKPLGQTAFFSDLETIFHTFGESMKPMATVLSLIVFVLVLFCIIGMSFWGQAAFRRRCVWADTLALKIPEQYCERGSAVEFPGCTAYGALNPAYFRGPQQGMNPACLARKDATSFTADLLRPELGLDNSCGPFQLCLDRSNPNYGFTSYDSLQGSFITLVQVMSGDSDVQVLWASIGAEAGYRPVTIVYYLLFGFMVIHVLINVLVAVFANVFASSRQLFEEKIELRRAGKVGFKKGISSSGTSRTASGDSASSSCSSASSRSTSPSLQSRNSGGAARSASGGSRSGDSKKSRQSTSREVGRRRGRQQGSAPTGKVLSADSTGENAGKAGQEEKEENGSEGRPVDENGIETVEFDALYADKDLENQKINDLEEQINAMQEAERDFERQIAMKRAREPFNKPPSWVLSRLKSQVDPSLQALFIFLFRNKFYDILTFTVIISIAFCLCGELLS